MGSLKNGAWNHKVVRNFGGGINGMKYMIGFDL